MTSEVTPIVGLVSEKESNLPIFPQTTTASNIIGIRYFKSFSTIINSQSIPSANITRFFGTTSLLKNLNSTNIPSNLNPLKMTHQNNKNKTKKQFFLSLFYFAEIKKQFSKTKNYFHSSKTL